MSRTTPSPADATCSTSLGAASASRRDGRDGDHELWRLTVDHSPVGMCLVSTEGQMVMPNRAFAEMIGYAEDELRGWTFHAITHPEDLAVDVELFEETMRGERSSYRLVKRFVHADGHVVWGDLSVALMHSDDGTPLHFISQVLDVTSQRQDRARLAQAVKDVERERNLLQAILDTVDVGLMLVERDGTIARINRRQEDLLAMAECGDVRDGVAQHGHFYGADGTTALAESQMPAVRAVAGEEFDDYRVWVGPDMATRRALSVSARTVRDAGGDPSGAALAFGDVTDLMNALQAREVFEGSVSHELRTPLTAVLGHLEMVLEDGGLSVSATRQLEVAQRNAVRLGSLVSDLLDTAARGKGTLALSPAAADVAALARDVVEAATPAAQAAGVTLEVHAPSPAPAMVDLHRVRQVLDNVVSNAVKYTDPGGRVDLVVETAGDVVTLTVTDTGIGIASEDLVRLFDPFFRADTARGRAAPGVGLGLGIARSIAVAHGGRMEVASRLGEGTTVRTVLPVGGPSDDA